MTVQDLQKTISNLEKILPKTSGMEKLELNDTIFELKKKLANLITSPLDHLNVNISQEDIDLLNQSASDVESAIVSEQQKTELVTKVLGIGKKILGFI
jgi:chromosome condensin MukBEF complex kleisin-like MukF subunit